MLFHSVGLRSFIRSTIVELLGAKSSEKQCLMLSGFGEKELKKEKYYNIYEIEVSDNAKTIVAAAKLLVKGF